MKRFRPSIRLRLTLWNASVVALLLTAFATAAWFTLRAVLRERGDATVRESARAIAGAVIAERNTARTRGDGERGRGEAARDALRELRMGDLDVFIADEAARVVAASRSPIVRSLAHGSPVHVPAKPPPQANRDTLVMPASVRTLLSEARSRDTGEVVVRSVLVDDDEWRAAVVRLGRGPDDTEPALVVAVLRSEAEDAVLLARVRTTLLLAIPLALLASVLAGYALARQSLAPMDAMTARAARISAATLSERLPIANEHDELGRLASVMNDLLGRVDDAFRAQRQFVADASHELRTPIAIVRGEADVTLRRASRDEAEYRDALAVIRDESIRLTRVVDDLFLLARADAGSSLDRHETVDLVELVAAGVRSVRTLAEHSGVSLELDIAHNIAAEALSVLGDQILLRRLLLNLLDNAVKYTRPGDRIHVRVTSSREEATVVIADNGPGVPAELRARVFDRFVRALPDTPDDTRTPGAGLGLAIAQAIAVAHHGTLTLDPPVLQNGAGASFRVVLPRA